MEDLVHSAILNNDTQLKFVSLSVAKQRAQNSLFGDIGVLVGTDRHSATTKWLSESSYGSSMILISANLSQVCSENGVAMWRDLD